MVKVLSYSYEGTAQVSCGECGNVYEVEFSGEDTTDIHTLIKEQLFEEGWDETHCLNCIEDDDEEYTDDPTDDGEGSRNSDYN